jgi:hypothetical protein
MEPANIAYCVTPYIFYVFKIICVNNVLFVEVLMIQIALPVGTLLAFWL